MIRPRLSIVGACICLSLLIAWTASAFVEPTNYPPSPDASAPPILTGPTQQTRSGPLTVEGLLTTSGTFIAQSNVTTTGDVSAVDNGEICLDDSCVSHWSQLTADNLVKLSPTVSDAGFIHLDGSMTLRGNIDTNYTLYTRAIRPTTEPTYGFYGQSYNAASSYSSYGVLGVAKHNNPGPYATGVFGYDSGNPNAYAGYFSGNVELPEGSELCMVSTSTPPTVECRPDWPNGIPSGNLLQLQRQWPFTEQSGRTAVLGAAQFRVGVLGSSAGHSQTCGDGICANGEDGTTCAIDCPAVTTISATWLTGTSATVTWQSNTPMTSVVHYGLSNQYGQIVSDTAFLSAHSLTLTGIDNTKDYHFQVGGTTQSTGTSFFSTDQVLVAFQDTIPPAIITSLSVSAINLQAPFTPPSYAQVTLNWTHNLQDLPSNGLGEFKQFRVYRKLASDSRTAPEIGVSTVTSFTDTYGGLVTKTNYTYQVAAEDRAGNISARVGGDIRIPLKCTTAQVPSFYCTNNDPGYNDCKVCSVCTPNLTCQVHVGGGSPIMAKLPFCLGGQCFGGNE